MRLLYRGLTQKQAAAKLKISTRTVEVHLAEIRARLGATTTTTALLMYYGSALIEPARPATPPIEPTQEALPQSLRFEILQRDDFTCQYCGRRPPDVQLHVDHRLARARGGSNERSNLVTACADCNQGKGVADSGNDTDVISTE